MEIYDSSLLVHSKVSDRLLLFWPRIAKTAAKNARKNVKLMVAQVCPPAACTHSITHFSSFVHNIFSTPSAKGQLTVESEQGKVMFHVANHTNGNVGADALDGPSKIPIL